MTLPTNSKSTDQEKVTEKFVTICIGHNGSGFFVDHSKTKVTKVVKAAKVQKAPKASKAPNVQPVQKDEPIEGTSSIGVDEEKKSS
jgi:hypothetical protein